MMTFTVQLGTRQRALIGVESISELGERNLHKRVAKARRSPWESAVRTVHTFQSENVAQSQQTVA